VSHRHAGWGPGVGRLGDTAFLERAPAQVVEGARTREAELAERVARLTASLR